MKRAYTRYTKELLETLVPHHQSLSSILKSLGKKPTGGSISNLRLMCTRWHIDISHMSGQGHNKGKLSSKLVPANKRLVLGKSSDHRVAAHKLRRALDEIGREYKCEICGINSWNGVRLVLEIDHINNTYWDNREHNLQYLCPNCHSQK